MLKTIQRIWGLISRLAFVIVEIDKGLMEFNAFRRWLFENEDEPNEPDKKKK